MKKTKIIVSMLIMFIMFVPNVVYGFSMDISANKQEINIGEEVIIQVKFSGNVPATHFYVKYDNTVFKFIEGINIPAAEKKNSRVACIYGDIEGVGTDTFYLRFKGLKASTGSDFILEDANAYPQDDLDNAITQEDLEGNKKVTVKVKYPNAILGEDDTISGGKLPQTGSTEILMFFIGIAIVGIGATIALLIKTKKIKPTKIMSVLVFAIAVSLVVPNLVYAVTQGIQEIKEKYEIVEIILDNENEERYITVKQLKEAKSDIQINEQDVNLVRTGMKVGISGKEKTIVQYGDGNADGVICDSNDLMVIIKDHTKKQIATGVYKRAVDLNRDGTLNQPDMDRIIERFLRTLQMSLVDEERGETVATIEYSTTEPTNENVVATIKFNKEGIKIINNEGKNTYTFTENGSFTFEYIDEDGYKQTATATVNNIDKGEVIATIEYSTTEPTNEDVVATIKFNKDRIVITNNGGKNTYTFTENGSFTFEYIDKTGKTGTATATVNNINRSLPNIDNTFEIKEGGETGEQYIPGKWTNKDVYFTFKPNTDGVTRTYEITGAQTVAAGATQPVTITAEGISIIKITAQDQAGNIAIKEYEVKIDKTAPEVGSMIMKKDNQAGENYTSGTWTNKDVYIEPVNGTDSLSGHESTTYEISGAATMKAGTTYPAKIVAEGISTVVLTTKDIAGNIATREYIIKINKTAPDLGDSNVILKLENAQGADYTPNTWTNKNVYFELVNTQEDIQMSYEITGAQVVAAGATQAVTITAEGISTIKVTAVDNAGNIATREYIVKINKTAPDIGDNNIILKLENAQGADYTPNTWTNKNVYFELVNTQADIRMSYEITGAQVVAAGATQATTITTEGISTIKVTAIDNAGNIATREYIVKIDKTAPEAGTLNMSKFDVQGEEYVNDTWTNSDVYIELVNGTDSLSGHSRTSYEVTGAATQSAGTMAPGLIIAEGISTVTVTTQDIAGNTATRQYIVKIKKSIGEDVTVDIQFNKGVLNVGENLQATVTHTNNSEINLDLSKSKWAYTNSASPLGNNSNNYSGGYINTTPCVFDTTMNTSGYVYLHVLTMDELGNSKETISTWVVVRQVATEIILNKTSLTMDVGEKEQLIRTILPDNTWDKGTTWTSSNPDIATVSIQGEVTAKAIGTAVITAAWTGDPNIKATCTVTVRAEDLASKAKVGDYVNYTTSQDYTGGWKIMSIEDGIIEIVSATGAQRVILGGEGSQIVEKQWTDGNKYWSTGWEGTLNFLNTQSRKFLNTTYADSARALGTDKNNPNICTQETYEADRDALGKAGASAIPLEARYFYAYTSQESTVDSSSRTIIKYYNYCTSSTEYPFPDPETGEDTTWTASTEKKLAYETRNGSNTGFSSFNGYSRPVIRLKEGIMTTSGDGTKNNPYQLFIK